MSYDYEQPCWYGKGCMRNLKDTCPFVHGTTTAATQKSKPKMTAPTIAASPAPASTTTVPTSNAPLVPASTIPAPASTAAATSGSTTSVSMGSGSLLGAGSTTTPASTRTGGPSGTSSTTTTSLSGKISSNTTPLNAGAARTSPTFWQQTSTRNYTCQNWHKTGTCESGTSCKFFHSPKVALPSTPTTNASPFVKNTLPSAASTSSSTTIFGTRQPDTSFPAPAADSPVAAKLMQTSPFTFFGAPEQPSCKFGASGKLSLGKASAALQQRPVAPPIFPKAAMETSTDGHLRSPDVQQAPKVLSSTNAASTAFVGSPGHTTTVSKPSAFSSTPITRATSAELPSTDTTSTPTTSALKAASTSFIPAPAFSSFRNSTPQALTPGSSSPIASLQSTPAANGTAPLRKSFFGQSNFGQDEASSLPKPQETGQLKLFTSSPFLPNETLFARSAQSIDKTPADQDAGQTIPASSGSRNASVTMGVEQTSVGTNGSAALVRPTRQQDGGFIETPASGTVATPHQNGSSVPPRTTQSPPGRTSTPPISTGSEPANGTTQSTSTTNNTSGIIQTTSKRAAASDYEDTSTPKQKPKISGDGEVPLIKSEDVTLHSDAQPGCAQPTGKNRDHIFICSHSMTHSSSGSSATRKEVLSMKVYSDIVDANTAAWGLLSQHYLREMAKHGVSERGTGREGSLSAVTFEKKEDGCVNLRVVLAEETGNVATMAVEKFGIH